MKAKKLTDKETEIMQMLWQRGALTVREMLEGYPEPKPHFNTVSTTVRILEQKGHVAHEEHPGGYRYYAVARIEDFRRRTLAEKISVDELRDLIEMIDRKSEDRDNNN